MKKVLIFILILGAGALFWYSQQTNSPTSNNQPSVSRSNQNNSNPTTETSDNYQDYSPQLAASELAAGKKVVLFFHASWCPTCKAAEREILSRANEIPENIVILRTDYDTENELKEKYGVTYQHTFVQIDENLDEVTKWNGGGLDAIIDRVK